MGQIIEYRKKIQLKRFCCQNHLLLWHDVLARVDLDDDVMRMLSVDFAANRLSSAQNLLDGSLQMIGHRSWSHCTRNSDDFIERNTAFVLD